jgi:DNA polymerase epsilon subunit 1
MSELTDPFLSANGAFDLFDDSRDDERFTSKSVDASDYIVDIREYDVPYHVRVMIDLGASPGKQFLLHNVNVMDQISE